MEPMMIKVTKTNDGAILNGIYENSYYLVEDQMIQNERGEWVKFPWWLLDHEVEEYV